MKQINCQGCRSRDEIIEKLAKRVDELEARSKRKSDSQDRVVRFADAVANGGRRQK